MLVCMCPGVPGPRMQEQAVTGLLQAAGLWPLVRGRCWRDRLPALFARESSASFFASCPSSCPSINQSINILNVLGCHWNPTHNSFSSVSLYSQICLLHPWVLGSSLHVITIYMLVTHSLAILCISSPPVCSCFYFCFFLFLFLPCISPPLPLPSFCIGCRACHGKQE